MTEESSVTDGKKKIFVSFAGVGDLVILIPLFRQFAASGQLDLLTRPYGPPVFADQSYIGKVFPLAHPNRGRKGVAKLLLGGHRRKLGAILAAENYDEIILYEQEREVITDWIDSWRGPNSKVKVFTYPELAPDRVLTAAKSLGLDISSLESVPRMDVSEEGKMAAHKRFHPLGNRILAVQPGAGHNKRQAGPRALPADTWVDILTRIMNDDGADAVVLHGSADQAESSDLIIQGMPKAIRSKFHNWCGKANLRELVSVLSESSAVLSVDTGPGHIAAAVGVPLLVIMGPSSPESYLPKGPGTVEYVTADVDCQYCMGTPRIKKCKDYSCMKMVTGDMLFDAWSRLLRSKDG